MAIAAAGNVTDNCDASLTMSASGGDITGTCVKTQVWTVTAATDCGPDATCSVTYTWTDDTQAPVITDLADITLPGCNTPWPPAPTTTFTDNCTTPYTLTGVSGEIVTDGCFQYRDYTFNVSDACGNAAETTVTRVTRLYDMTAPVLLGIPENITAECDAIPAPPVIGVDITATDACDADVTITFNESDDGSCNNDGKTVPASGNGLIWEIPISGTNLTASDINKLSLIFQTNKGKGVAEFTLIAPNGQAVILVGSYCSTGECITPQVPGTTYMPIFYSCSSGYDKWNNSDYIPAGIEVPMQPYGALSSPNSGYLQNMLTPLGLTLQYVSCFENFTGVMDGTWRIYSRKQENANGDLKYVGACLLPGQCPQEYTVTRTWTATDDCGNSVSQSQIITIQDTQPPVFADCPAQPIDLGFLDIYPTSATAIAYAGTVTDNCATPSVTAVGGSVTGDDCNKSQEWTVTATDDCGNSAICIVTLTWTIDADPMIFTEAVNDDFGCNPQITPPVFTGIDDCTVSFEPNVATDGPTNTGCLYTQTWTATYTDDNGNSATPVSITYTWTVVTAPVIANLPAGGDLGCNPTPPECSNTVTASNECGTVEVSCTPGEILENGWNRIQTFTYSASECNLSDTKTVTYTWTVVPESAQPIVQITEATCFAPGSATISNYNEAYTYTFTPGGPTLGSSGLISGLTFGTSYTVTATNSSNCTSLASAPFSIMDMLPTPVQPIVQVTAATCSAPGSATITNYNEAYTYIFTPGGPTLGSSGLISGMDYGQIYTVTATNNDDCISVASASFSVMDMLPTPDAPTVQVTAATCEAAGTATITNYNPLYIYTFSPIGPGAGANGVISGMDYGQSYTVTATNSDDCTSAFSAEFSIMDMLPTPDAPTVQVTAATCEAAGTATITNYNELYTYAFSPTGPSAGAGGVISGFTTGVSYTVTATNSSLCISIASDPFMVQAAYDAPLQPIVQVTAATCSAAGTATITNYNAAYIYTFTPEGPTVGSNGLISGLTYGTSYTVTATSGQCTSPASVSFSIMDMLPTPEQPTVQITAATCEAAGTATITNYNAAYTYTFTPEGPTVGSNGLISGLTYGTSYTVTATNSSNCNSAASAPFDVDMQNTASQPVIANLPMGGDLGCNPTALPTCSTAVTASNDYGAVEVSCTPGQIVIDGCERSQIFTYTATACGLTDTETVTYTWKEDLTPPTFTYVPLDITLECDDPDLDCIFPTEASMNMGGRAVTDNCDSHSIVFDGAVFQNGHTTFTYTVTSGSAPALSHWVLAFCGSFSDVVAGPGTVQLGLDPTTGVRGIKFDDGLQGGQTMTYYITLPGNWNTGMITTAVKAGQSICYYQVQGPVCDELPPPDNCPDMPTATDNCDDNVTITYEDVMTPGDCASEYTVIRTFTATDECGNTATATQTITVIDITPPVLPELPEGGDLGCNPTPPVCVENLVAQDNCAGEVPVICTPGEITGDCIKTQVFTYSATDLCGNTSSETVTYTWTVDTEDPVFSGCPDAPVAWDWATEMENPTCADALALVTVTDNCGTVAPVCQPGAVVVDGCNRSLTFTLTAEDNCENTAQCSVTFTWAVDDDDPQFVGCPSEPIDLGCNPVNLPDCNDALALVTVTDGCSGTLTPSCSPGSIVADGCARSQTFTLTATDAQGNTAACDVTYTWTVVSAPVIANLPTGDDLGCNPTSLPTCSTAVTASNECGPVDVSCTPGQIVIDGCERSQIFTYTATACGLTDTETVTYTWTVDTEDPIFTGCPDAPLAWDWATELEAPTCADALALVTVSDNCSGTLTPVCQPGSVVVDGCNHSLTFTLTAEDNCENTAECSVTFTWTVDDDDPQFVGCPSEPIDLGCNPVNLPDCDDALALVTVTDGCSGTLTPSCAPGSVAEDGCTRSQTFTLTATDAQGNTATCEVTYTWTVVTAPVIANLPQGGELGCNPTTLPTCSTTVTASNECGPVDVNCTPGTVIENGCNRSQTFTYTATACGLSDTETVTYTWTVVTAPVIANLPLGGDLGCNPTTLPTCSTTVTASNECGPVEVSCTPGEILIDGCELSQTFTYTATACDLTDTKTVTYNWTVVTAPVIANLPLGGDLGCNPTSLPTCSTNVTASNECGAVEVSCTPGTIVENGCNRSQTFTYTATACGLTDTETVTYTWTVDTEDPVFSGCPDAPVAWDWATKLVAPTCADALALVTVTDNCGTVTPDCQAGTLLVNGTIYSLTFTLTAEDNCDNTAECSITFIWTYYEFDINCPDESILLGCNPTPPTCEDVYALLFASIEGYTDILSPTCTPGEIIVENCQRTQIFTVSYMDAMGNLATCEVTYTWVVDLTPPVISNPVSVVAFTCEEEVVLPEVEFTDNCSEVTIFSFIPGFDGAFEDYTFAKGSETTVCYYALDECGNRSQDYCLTIRVDCDNCTMTQGFYGNQGGLYCDGSSTLGLLNTLLETPLVLGSTTNNRRYTIPAGAGQCVINILPGSGPSKALPPNGPFTCGDLVNKRGILTNNLLAQTLTLGLNLRLDGALGDLVFQSASFFTRASSDCNNSEAEPLLGTEEYYTMPSCIMELNGGLPSVQNIYDLANAALGGANVGCSLGTITEALGIINDALDECRFIYFYNGTPIAGSNTTNEVFGSEDNTDVEKIQLSVVPNPFVETIEVTFTINEDTRVTAEIYDMQGRLVTTLFEGDMVSSETRTIVYKVPAVENQAMFLCIIRTSDAVKYEKIIRMH
ncbi:MAG: T9SS type A sorting domain-containing protein [Lentimicrobium sp.]|nr:T9SS type A sorting domain-containing protein [Lentimicrobium sp.]